MSAYDSDRGFCDVSALFMETKKKTYMLKLFYYIAWLEKENYSFFLDIVLKE